MEKSKNKSKLNKLKEKEIVKDVSFTDNDTGEIYNGKQVTKFYNRNNFHILYMDLFLTMLDKVGGKKLIVIKYLLKNKDSNGIVLKTVAELVKETKISKPTIIETLKILESNKIITRKTGSLMFNPQFINKGSESKEEYLIVKFEEFNSNDKETESNDKE